jgi:ribosomal peptide maturation radical SAM protein 1
VRQPLTLQSAPAGSPLDVRTAAVPAGMTFHLVEMPWHALGAAPLALAIVRGRLSQTHPGLAVTEDYLNIRWAEYLLRQSHGTIAPQHYHLVADKGVSSGLGDWVFAGALYGDPDWQLAAVAHTPPTWDPDASMLLAMRAMAGGFIEQAAASIARQAPDIVGFTTTFMQSVPALALARRLKQLLPGTRIIFGGANCDGPMGAALHRNHRFVDYAVRGEAELVLPQLIDRIIAGDGADGLDGVCWWDGTTPLANPQRRPAVPQQVIPEAEYSSWHQEFRASPVAEYVAPLLVVEGSRGCWWGQRHHCTFCGLNDDTIQFRAKPAGRFFSELARLVTEHHVLDIITSDNIMDPAYFREMLPRLAQTGWDLRIHYELKANVRAEQIAQLADAGLVIIQAGIESLSTRVLKLMDKGVDGPSNVRVLRECQDAGVSVAWNWLYGFPGESADDYWPVIRQLPALAHLEPPGQGWGSRIELERFSPYFQRPDLGFANRRAASFYSSIYDLPPAELDDIAYYFDCDDNGITGDVEDALNQAIATWASQFPASHLYAEPLPDGTLILCDERTGWPQRTVELTGWRKLAYTELHRARAPEALHARLAQAAPQAKAQVPATDAVRNWLASMQEQGLVFTDGGKWVALATHRFQPKIAAQ